eukprot:TRINITY_DN15125_c0_g1_i1.p1 TRINITY_DN15125_c0_g1~~TRINITY_DN15125_c0_g1_i1.p1  ORF type:complete len:741 (+),score=220.08 TRINITY_DN15125_c0_g1_i1:83-2305(+)
MDPEDEQEIRSDVYTEEENVEEDRYKNQVFDVKKLFTTVDVDILVASLVYLTENDSSTETKVTINKLVEIIKDKQIHEQETLLLVKEEKKLKRRPSLKSSQSNQNNLLRTVLKEPIFYHSFHFYLKKHFCSEFLLFWNQVEYYRSVYQELTPKERLGVALTIASTFLGKQAPFQLNISNELIIPIKETLKNLVENPYCKDGKGISIDIYNFIQDYAYNNMAVDSFTNFQKEDLYQNSKDLYSYLTKINVKDSEITKKDWGMLMTGAILGSVKKGEILIKQGIENRFFYRLESGKLSVSKNNITIAQISNIGSVFGELGVLRNAIPTASVTAEEDCFIKRLQVPFVLNLCITKPKIGYKFFCYLGAKLSSLLISKYQVPKYQQDDVANNDIDENFIDSNPKNEEEKDQFLTRFPNMPKSELVITDFEATFEKKAMQSYKGILYITQQYICFYSSKSFGTKIKEIIPIYKIQKIVNSKNTVTITSTKKKILKLKIKSEDMAIKLINLVNTMQTNQNIELTGNEQLSNEKSNAYNHAEKSITISDEDWDILFKDIKKIDLCPKTNIHNINELIENNNYENNNSPAAKKKSNANNNNNPSSIFQIKSHTFYLTFLKGDYIIQQFSLYTMVCKIHSGSCSVIKTTENNTRQFIGVLQEGDIFGSSGYFGCVSPYSVIANDDKVVIVVICRRKIENEVVPKYPIVATRFVHFLCSKLTSEIVRMESSVSDIDNLKISNKNNNNNNN